MTCRIAYICGKQGLSIIPTLSEIAEGKNLMIFPSEAALRELDDEVYNVSPIVSADFLRKALEIFSPDVIVVMTYLSKLDCSLSELSKYGMINIHPSLLPKYRGGSPIFYALKNGEEKVGVTYHFITEAFDQGEVINQVAINVLPKDCASSIWLKVIKKIVSSLPTVIECRSEWSSMATKQNEDEATSVGFPSPDEKSLNCLASVTENLSVIRACGRASGARLLLEGHVLFVTEASVSTTLMNVDGRAATWMVSDNVLFLKVLDGWLKVSEAYFNGKNISSWGFLTEEVDCGI